MSGVLEAVPARAAMVRAGTGRITDHREGQGHDVARRHGVARGSGTARGAVAIAAITSCTNTSDPRLAAAAGCIARKAARLA